MKVTERDDLLIRVDEKTANIYKLTEQQERHLAKLNEKVAKNVTDIATTKTRLEALETNGLSLKLSKKQVLGGGGSVVTLLIMVLYAIGKMNGWW